MADGFEATLNRLILQNSAAQTYTSSHNATSDSSQATSVASEASFEVPSDLDEEQCDEENNGASSLFHTAEDEATALEAYFPDQWLCPKCDDVSHDRNIATAHELLGCDLIERDYPEAKRFVTETVGYERAPLTEQQRAALDKYMRMVTHLQPNENIDNLIPKLKRSPAQPFAHDRPINKEDIKISIAAS